MVTNWPVLLILFPIKSVENLKSAFGFADVPIPIIDLEPTNRSISVVNGEGLSSPVLISIEFLIPPFLFWVNVVVKLSKYDFYAEDGELLSTKHLNNRNTKLICEYIENVLYNDPYSFEFDEYELMQEEFDFNQEMIFEERRLSNI